MIASTNVARLRTGQPVISQDMVAMGVSTLAGDGHREVP